MELTQRPVDPESGGVEIDQTDCTATQIPQLINENKVMFFSLSYCAYCFELKRTLTQLG